MNWMSVAKFHWRTTLFGIPPLLAGLSTLFAALAPLFHDLSVGDFIAANQAWPHVATAIALVSAGITGIVASDGAKTKD